MNDQTNLETTLPSLSSGQKLAGCYILKSLLSSPGAPEIWLAQDEVLGKNVTLHMVPEGITKDLRAISELRQEVKRNRQLIHPNILRVYDFIEDGPRMAVAMDRIEGESLAEVLKRKGVLDGPEAAALLKQLAETLGDAHRMQLYHRDLSPANLYLKPTGGLMVSNFGLARATHDAMERAGLAKGEAAHLAMMSPQQIDGVNASAADDIYGIGALAYELLTGRPPFSGEDLVPQIRKAVPAPLADARGGKGAPLSEAWQAFVSACLAKSPTDRPQSISEVIAALQKAASSAAPVAGVESNASKPTEPAALKVMPPAPEVSQSRSAGMAATGAVTKSDATNQLPPPAPAGKRPLLSPGPVGEKFPDLDRPKSKLPIIGLGAAAAVLAVGLLMRMKDDGSQDGGAWETSGDAVEMVNAPAPSPVVDSTAVAENPAPAPVTGQATSEPSVQPGTPNANPQETPKPAVVANVANPGGTGVSKAEAKPALPTPTSPTEESKAPTPAELIPSEPGDLPSPVALPAPPPLPAKLAVPKGATRAQIEQLTAEREDAAKKLREAAAAIDAAQAENTKRQQIATAELDAMKKALDEKKKILAPVLQQASKIEVERARLEDAAKKAKAAAQEAAKTAEAAQKAYDELVATAGEKLAAREAADNELKNLAASITVGGLQAEQLATEITKGQSLRQQVQLALRQLDTDRQILSGELEKFRSAEVEAMKRTNQTKIAALEKQMGELRAQVPKLDAAITSLNAIGDDEATKAAVQRVVDKKETVMKQIADLANQVKALNNPDLPVPATTHGDANPVPPAQPTTIENTAPTAPTTTPDASAALGIVFVPVGDVFFSTTPVTQQQFSIFAADSKLTSTGWKRGAGPDASGDHPVVWVNWREADSFCKWLTTRDRASKAIKPNEAYRLPTDAEWSKAIGLPAESGATPEERDLGVPDVYPWGNAWPPPPGAGNYAGEETKSGAAIEGYDDGFPYTSPVGRFKANALGLFDMSGNVWQWVQDDWNAERREKVLRGGSWSSGQVKFVLFSSSRFKASPDTATNNYGFRIVRASSGRPATQPARR